MASTIAFIDTEVSLRDNRIHDFGAVRSDGAQYHGPSAKDFHTFIKDVQYLCGHNVYRHDAKFLALSIPDNLSYIWIDTLPFSPLLFPKKPYHRLVKDDKLIPDEINNPLADSVKAKELFFDEIGEYVKLPGEFRQILYDLLSDNDEFYGFFHFIHEQKSELRLEKSAGEADTASMISGMCGESICKNAPLKELIKQYPVALAYVLALIRTGDTQSLLPAWVQVNYPETSYVMKKLCGTPCGEGCPFCEKRLDTRKALKRFFGHDAFRLIGGEPLQERAANEALKSGSLLAVFPTGGGKSITFQIPALIQGENERGLSVVISPLQSLMKDQVDNIAAAGITGAVTINGLLNPLERADAISRVSDGGASLLYISPELLRSNTIERLLMKRNVVRFIIDEAHCFSAWGQDFRVDYLYIGEFIRKLQEKTGRTTPIPVSCFTATAKQKVISDILDYFNRTLGLSLSLFTSAASRENLRYRVLHQESDNHKYRILRELIEQKNCPTIVYVSRVKRSFELAKKLSEDGIASRPFNGQMDPAEKIANQDAFIHNEIDVIVATSAFGMGVDKKDVQLVIHYDISDSLENYVQEAGRAGRDPSMQAECYVLYNDNDLDKHFVLLNQTKLSISEIQQVWVSIKRLCGHRNFITCSALEIAREAGWDNAIADVEMRVRTAVAALENAGYVERGNNSPRVYATSINAENMTEARQKIEKSRLIPEAHKQNAIRIMNSLISARSISEAGNADAESRIDYLADILGLEKEQVIGAVSDMREEGLLADYTDMTALISISDSTKKSIRILERFAALTEFLLSALDEEQTDLDLKELNKNAQDAGLKSTVKDLRTILYYLAIKNEIEKKDDYGANRSHVTITGSKEQLKKRLYLRTEMGRFVLETLFARAEILRAQSGEKDISVPFSVVGMYQAYQDTPKMEAVTGKALREDMEDTLLYLSKTGAIRLEGGFLVLYNGMQIKRTVTDNKLRYKVEDYRTLNEFYQQRMQQIHIVGEYANLMVKDYDAALQYVQDYFRMDYKAFISKYFKGEKAKEITRNITSKRYRELYGTLSEKQLEVIEDDKAKHIAVLAGPGSGKTRLLVHKMAALLQLDDVKAEQLLMLTFSRAAATEFKERLIDLMGNAAHYVEVKTFHSYCYDLIGRQADPETLNDVVDDAVTMLEYGDIERVKIMKRVLLIDEAQDMAENDYRLIRALMHANDDMRVIAVGDDDQNIYGFRGSDSKYFKTLTERPGAVSYELPDNYRSARNIIAFADAFAKTIRSRMKTSTICPVRRDDGEVRVIRYSSPHMEEALVAKLLAGKNGNPRTAPEPVEGPSTRCILTRTNKEAATMLALLNREGIRATLIQSTDAFRLYDLEEVRFFLKQIRKQEDTVTAIHKDTWKRSLEALKTRYHDSNCLPAVLRLLEKYASLYRVKYLSDLMEFIYDSTYEEYGHDDNGETVIVSTMHKAKGREFDTVYLLLSNARAETDEEKRLLYVAMTRAKNRLEIHCDTNLFDHETLSHAVTGYDQTKYQAPGCMLLPLALSDVNLGWFKGRERTIFRLHSGHPLTYRDGYCYAMIDGIETKVCMLSKKQKENLVALQNDGCTVDEAYVNFVVAWRDKNLPAEERKETAILLPLLHLVRRMS